MPSDTAGPTSPDAPVSETSADWIETFTAATITDRAELVHRICDRIAAGELLRDIATEKDMPSRGTFERWCRAHPEIANEYGTAQKLRCEDIIDEIIATARDGDSLLVQQTDDEGIPRVVVSKDALASRQMKINTLDKMLGRIWPRRFTQSGEGVILEPKAVAPIEAPRDVAAARVMGNVIVLENRIAEDHPMRDEILNWQRIAEEAKKR